MKGISQAVRRAWTDGDTFLWACSFLVALALVAFVLSLLLPIHLVVQP